MKEIILLRFYVNRDGMKFCNFSRKKGEMQIAFAPDDFLYKIVTFSLNTSGKLLTFVSLECNDTFFDLWKSRMKVKFESAEGWKGVMHNVALP